MHKLISFRIYIDIDDFDKALESVFTGKATILNRMRLACTFYDKDLAKKSKDGDGETPFSLISIFILNLHPDWQVMNEIALHRGSSPHLNTIDIFVDGQHLTEAVVCYLPFHSTYSSFNKRKIVRRSYSIHTNRLNSILLICWRSHRTSIFERPSPNPHLSTKSLISATRLPIIIDRHLTSTPPLNSSFRNSH